MADPAYIVDGVLTDGEAWVALASTTLTGTASEITFTSTDDGQVGDWSQYMDLVIISYVRYSTGATYGDYLAAQYNNDTASNYAYQIFYCDGASPSLFPNASTTTSAYLGYAPRNGDTANVFSATVSHLFDINSGKYKSSVSQSANDMDGNGQAWMSATTWKSQAPISEIDMIGSGETFAIGTRIDLFGILPRMVA